MAAARAEVDAARGAGTEAAGHRRTADEAERQAGRRAEHAAREAAWGTARADALEEELRPLRDRLAALEAMAPLPEIGDLPTHTAPAPIEAPQGVVGLTEAESEAIWNEIERIGA